MNRKSLIPMILATLVAAFAQADSMTGLAAPAGVLRPVDRVVVHKAGRKM